MIDNEALDHRAQAHRIAKAYLQGERTIAAVVIDDYPPPDGMLDTR